MTKSNAEKSKCNDKFICNHCKIIQRKMARILKDTENKPFKQRYFSEKWVSKRLGLEVKTLQAWRQQRTDLPYYKFVTTVRYRLRDIQEFERNRRIASTSDSAAQEAA